LFVPIHFVNWCLLVEDLLFVAPIRCVGDLLFVVPIRLSPTYCLLRQFIIVHRLLFVVPIGFADGLLLLFWCLLMEDLLRLVATLLLSCFVSLTGCGVPIWIRSFPCVSSTGCGVPIWLRSFPLRRVLSGRLGPLLFDAVIQFRGLLLNNVERV
jgi:hypothetical protein